MTVIKNTSYMLTWHMMTSCVSLKKLTKKIVTEEITKSKDPSLRSSVVQLRICD